MLATVGSVVFDLFYFLRSREMKKFLLTIFILAAALAITACNRESNNNVNPIVFLSGEELSGTLTVSTFDSMLAGPFVEEAARMFTEIHQNVTINVESFSSPPKVRMGEGASGGVMFAITGQDNPQERRDYVNMINTELMSGRGADILAMDVLPFHQYARNGQLVNLRDFIEQDPYFDINDYRVNIFDALTTEDGLFMFPLDYSFNYITFDSTLLPEEHQAALLAGNVFTYEQLIELGSQAFENNQLLFPMQAGPRPGLFMELFMLNYNRFIDINNRTANFTDGVFEEMLTQILSFESEGFLRPRAGAPETIMRNPEEMLEMMRSEQPVFAQRSSMQLLNNFHAGSGVVGMNTRNMSLQSEDDVIAGLVGNDRGEIPFTVGNAFGINSNSDNQALAWEFIKFLSSYAMTESLRVRGLPTHIGAFEERAAMSILGTAFNFRIAGGGGLGIQLSEEQQAMMDAAFAEAENADESEMNPEQQAAFEAYVEAVTQFTNQLNIFDFTDLLIEEIVLTEVGEFFDGARSAEDVAQTLQSRITLFLNE